MAIGDVIHVRDTMQVNYGYILEAEPGQNFDAEFKPHFTPVEMLAQGVFEGRYINDCRDEFPGSWFVRAKLSEEPNPLINRFGVKSRQPLSVWQKKGWIIGPDPRGWFQWYCRYYLGRRIPEIDKRQIARWKAFARHAAQVRHNCYPRDLGCRPKQRQALLQWSYDPFI